MRNLIGKCVGYFLLGFCCLSLVGWWKGHHDATANLEKSQIRRVIFENLELRRVKSGGNFYLSYSCDGKPIYTIDLDTHQLTSSDRIGSSDSVFRPALIIPASEIALWGLGGASGLSLINKGKLLVAESATESPSWRAISFVAGAITGYMGGYWLGSHSHPKCLSTQVINEMESFDSRVAIQNDVYSSFLLDIFVVVDSDTKNPIPFLSAVPSIDAYQRQHPGADFRNLMMGFHGLYPILLQQMAKKDWLSNGSAFQTAEKIRSRTEELFKAPSPQLMEALGAHKSLRITETYELIHDPDFLLAYRSRQES